MISIRYNNKVFLYKYDKIFINEDEKVNRNDFNRIRKYVKKNFDLDIFLIDDKLRLSNIKLSYYYKKRILNIKYKNLNDLNFEPKKKLNWIMKGKSVDKHCTNYYQVNNKNKKFIIFKNYWFNYNFDINKFILINDNIFKIFKTLILNKFKKIQTNENKLDNIIVSKPKKKLNCSNSKLFLIKPYKNSNKKSVNSNKKYNISNLYHCKNLSVRNKKFLKKKSTFFKK